MAITRAIPQVWSARLLRAFDRASVWPNLVTDVSSEVAEGGDQVHLSQLTSTVTVNDYTKDGTIAAPERATDAEQILRLTEQKYFNIAMDDIDRVQARPNLMDEFARKAGVAISEEADSYLKSVYLASFPSGASVDYTKPPATITDAWRSGLVMAILRAIQYMDDQKWPGGGRYMVVSTSVKRELVTYLAVQKGIGTGSTGDSAFANAELTRFFGLPVYVDTTLANATAAGNPYCLFGLRSAIFWARQISRVEPYRPENTFADALKGLYVYGALRVEPQSVYRIVQEA